MKYELPDPAWVEQQKRNEVPNVIVTPDAGESLIDKAVRIACAAVELCPPPNGLGIFDPHVNENLIAEDDILSVRNAAEKGMIHIDYWKGRPVKLALRLTEGRISISLNSWADRWEMNETNTIPAIAVTNLEQVLALAST